MTRAMEIIAAVPRRALWLLVSAYRLFLRPILGANCRYAPSCSAYAQEALLTHGAIKGGFLSIRRILRCHPWGGSGYDPVPQPSRPPKTSPDAKKASGFTSH